MDLQAQVPKGHRYPFEQICSVVRVAQQQHIIYKAKILKAHIAQELGVNLMSNNLCQQIRNSQALRDSLLLGLSLHSRTVRDRRCRDGTKEKP